MERVGDWVCIKCKNLNFSFRVICNRCQMPKMESEKMFEQHMGNLINYAKLNDMTQYQMPSNNSPMMGTNKNFIANNNISINNNFYQNFHNSQNTLPGNLPNLNHNKQQNLYQSGYNEQTEI
jgi:hypothetical protein